MNRRREVIAHQRKPSDHIFSSVPLSMPSMWLKRLRWFGTSTQR